MFDNSSADTPMLTIHWPPLEGAAGSPPEGAERSPPEGAEGSPPEGSHKEMHQILKVLDIIECQLVAGTDLLQFTVSSKLVGCIVESNTCQNSNTWSDVVEL